MIIETQENNLFGLKANAGKLLVLTNIYNQEIEEKDYLKFWEQELFYYREQNISFEIYAIIDSNGIIYNEWGAFKKFISGTILDLKRC